MTTLSKPAKALSSVRYLAFVLVALSLTIVFAGKANSTTSDNTSGSGNAKKYLFLNAEQLKPLGVELSEKGYVFANHNPNYKKDKQKYSCIAFVADENTPSVSMFFDKPNELEDAILEHVIFQGKKMTSQNFYPHHVSDTQGNYSFADGHFDRTRLVPVAFSMSETKLPNRNDIVVFWFNPTEDLQKALPEGIYMENYLRIPDASMDEIREDEELRNMTKSQWEKEIIEIGSVNPKFPESPTFPGGGEALLKYLKENIKYPEDARHKNIKGTVMVQGDVENDGSFSNIWITGGSLSGNFDKEAIRVVKNMPKWIPTKNKKQKYSVSVYIRFSTED